MADDETNQQPTPEDVAKAGEVSMAAAQAAGSASTEAEARTKAREAIDRKADEVQLKLSDEDKTEIVDMFIERLNSLGAFDAPPPAPAPAAAAATPEAAAETLAEAEAAQPPEKKSFAERFAGI